jgi:hypothetical protein
VAGTRLALLLQGVNDNSLNGGCMCTDVEDSQMWTGDQLCVCLGILDRDPARAKAGGCDLFAKRPVRQVGVRPDSTWLSWQWDQQRSGSISQIQTEACRGLHTGPPKSFRVPQYTKVQDENVLGEGWVTVPDSLWRKKTRSQNTMVTRRLVGTSHVNYENK